MTTYINVLLVSYTYKLNFFDIGLDQWTGSFFDYCKDYLAKLKTWCRSGISQGHLRNEEKTVIYWNIYKVALTLEIPNVNGVLW